MATETMTGPAVIEKPATAVEVTDAAISEIKRQRDLQGMPEAFLRVGISGGGCSGTSYALGLDTDLSPDDHTYEVNGLKIAIDARSLPLISGRKLDFITGPSGAGFRLEGGEPLNSGGGCGSGGGGCGCGRNSGGEHAEEEHGHGSKAGGCGSGSGSCC